GRSCQYFCKKIVIFFKMDFRIPTEKRLHFWLVCGKVNIKEFDPSERGVRDEKSETRLCPEGKNEAS
ncbi:MAG: hypothetical protein IIU00_04225, partial [Clostridia bacterium]|nr:hypothetical protein [Clostridia bacterium]